MVRGSTPNTAAFHYFDRSNPSTDCKADKQKIIDQCNDTPENRRVSKESIQKANLNASKANATTKALTSTLKSGVTAIDGLGKKKNDYIPNRKNRWMEQHCSGLWHKPGGGVGKKAE